MFCSLQGEILSFILFILEIFKPTNVSFFWLATSDKQKVKTVDEWG